MPVPAKKFKIVHYDSPPREDYHVVHQAMVKFNTESFGQAPDFFYYFLKDDLDQVKGGIFGQIYKNTIFIDSLWVHDSLRGQGHGSELMQKAELLAKSKGCKYSTTDTFDFQARPFYEKLGYKVIADMPDFYNGRQRWFLRKTL